MTTEVSETLEKIRQYVQKTNMGSSIERYTMSSPEVISLLSMADLGMAIITSFDYGRAKGYRAAVAISKRKLPKGGSENV